MHIAIDNIEDVKVVHLSGRLDATSTPLLEKHLEPIFEEDKPKIIFNMEHIDYLSSAGMRLMVSVTNRVSAVGGVCGFCSLGENILETVQMTGLDKVLTIFPSEVKALASLSKSS